MKIANNLVSISVDEKNLGGVSITDKRSGFIWKTSDTPFIIRAWEAITGRCEYYPLVSSEKIDVHFNHTNHKSIEVSYWHKEIRLGFKIYYSLLPDGFEIKLPMAGIRERDNGLTYRYYNFAAIEVFPMFGAATAKEKGYLVIPMVSGALYQFGKKTHLCEDGNTDWQLERKLGNNADGPREHEFMVYTDQRCWKDMGTLPIWGAVRGKSGYWGHITSGQFDAAIKVRADYGKKQSSAVNSVFHYRLSRFDPIDQVDRNIRFHFLDGTCANYSTMAKGFRDYLIQEKGVRTLKQKMAKEPAIKKLVNGGNIHIWHGYMEYRENQPKQIGELLILITYKQATKLVRKLKKSGVENAHIVLVGCVRESQDGAFPTILPIDERLGTREDFDELVATINKLGYSVTPHVNYMDGLGRSPDFSFEDTMKDRKGHPQLRGWWCGGLMYAMCPDAIRKYAKRDFPRLKELGFKGIIYFDDQLGPLYSCHDATHPINRRQYLEANLKTMKYAREMFGSVKTEWGTCEMLEVMDATSNIGYKKEMLTRSLLWEKGLAHELVPLTPMVLHGLCLYGPGKHIVDLTHIPVRPYAMDYETEESPRINTEKLLNAVESGSGYIGEQELLVNPNDAISEIRKVYEILVNKLGYLQTEFMENHQCLASGVYQTTYSNGESVIVNYNEKTFEYKEHKVKPRSFLLIKK